MIPEPLPDIEAQVKDHTQRAWVLSVIEVLPPGYSRLAWAILLMDNTYNKLLSRYHLKVAAEVQRLSQVLPRDVQVERAEKGMGFLPIPPRTLPPELIAKAREVRSKWLGELVALECQNALARLNGMPLTDLVLREAQSILQETLAGMAEQLGPVPYTAKALRQGGFLALAVEGEPTRRSLR